MKQELDTKIFALGGLGEVGKNMYVLNIDETILFYKMLWVQFKKAWYSPCFFIF